MRLILLNIDPGQEQTASEDDSYQHILCFHFQVSGNGSRI
jgi:hypothetical protein